jgi:hypothetical protein
MGQPIPHDRRRENFHYIRGFHYLEAHYWEVSL